MPPRPPSPAGARVLVLGGGGREHALAWRLAADPEVASVLVAPGNGGTDGEPKVRNLALDPADPLTVASWARRERPDLVVVGPEIPLLTGVADGLRDADVPVLGPNRAAALLEGSKRHAKAFLEAVKDDALWPLAYPLDPREAQMNAIDVHDPAQVLWRHWPVTEGYIADGEGRVACKIYKRLPARHLWNEIMRSTYDYAEPGFILIDRVNEFNNNWWCEDIRATNPCGEQPLPPYGSCLLGSVNLTSFVRDPFTPAARFDWDTYREVVRVFTRMLDNVVEINGLPLERQRREITRKRRHGMGFLGLGSTLVLLGLRYGSEEAARFTEDAAREMAIVGWEEAVALAREKGPAPILEEEFEITPAMLARRPELARDGHRAGDRLPGRVLHARYSRYLQRLGAVRPDLVAALAETGARFTHHTSIAPTGTISLALANNASNGIEPSFAHHYFRNIIREGRKTKERVDVYSYELLAYRTLVDAEADPETETGRRRLPPSFVASNDIAPREHVVMQAAAQRWIDSSISKTVNVPTDCEFEEFKHLYLEAYEAGLKGCTTFRFNPEAFQGVLVRQEDQPVLAVGVELERRSAQRRGQRRRRRRERTENGRGKVEDDLPVLPTGDEFPAPCREANRLGRDRELVEENVRGGQRGVAAKRDLGHGTEPAKRVRRPAGREDEERRLRKTVLFGHRLKDPLLRPTLEEDDRGRVAAKPLAHEGVDVVERHALSRHEHTSPARRDLTRPPGFPPTSGTGQYGNRRPSALFGVTASPVMSLKRNTLYNIAGTLVPTVAALVVVPLYLERIGTARYGILALVWLLLGYFGVFDLGLSRASSNLVAQLETAPDAAREQVFWTALLLNAAFGVVGGLALYGLGRPLLGEWIRMPPELRTEALSALPWLALAVPVATMTGVMTGVLEGRRRFGVVNLFQVGGSLLFQIVPLVVAYAAGPGLEILIPVAVATRIVGTLPFAYLVKRDLPLRGGPRFEKRLARQLLGYGGWVTLTGVISPFLTTVDRFVIGAVRGASAIAFYTVPSNLVKRVTLAPGALARAIFPNFSAATSTEAARLSHEAVRTLNAFLVPLVVGGLWVLRPFLVLWLGLDFARRALPVGEILLVGFWINSLAFIPFALLQAQGRPDVCAKFHLYEVVPFLIVLWWGLHTWGLAGAAMAWTLRVSVDAGLLFGASRHSTLLLDVFWPGGFLVIGAFLGVYFLPPLPALLQTAVALLLFAVCAAWALYESPRLRREAQAVLSYLRSAVH